MIPRTILMILFNLICGTIMLLHGVKLMGEGLEKTNKKIMVKVLTTLTGKVWSAFLVGTFATALVQSSTAVTLLTVGFVNSGIMKLSQAVGIILGANIGTTVTAQLISFNLTRISIPAIVLGFCFMALSRNKIIKNIGQSVAGVGFMFAGLMVLNSSVPYIQENPNVHRLFLTYGLNPYISLLIGMLTTALVHSSSATVGITIVLFNAQLISLESAITLMLGGNIGTCITAQIASLQGNIAAKRTAWAHTLYNVIGVAAALLCLQPFIEAVRLFTLFWGQDETRLVANSHTLFNVLSAIFFLPLTRLYVRFIEWLVPE